MSMVATRFRLAASWRIAAELCASRPGWRIYELHPGGGQDDVLSLREGTSTEHVALNREGTMHVFGTGWTGDGSWDRYLAEDGTVGVVKDILASFPSSTHKAKPADRAAVVTCRTIATVLTQRLFDADEWDARSQALDSSGGQWPAHGSRLGRSHSRFGRPVPRMAADRERSDHHLAPRRLGLHTRWRTTRPRRPTQRRSQLRTPRRSGDQTANGCSTTSRDALGLTTEPSAFRTPTVHMHSARSSCQRERTIFVRQRSLFAHPSGERFLRRLGERQARTSTA